MKVHGLESAWRPKIYVIAGSMRRPSFALTLGLVLGAGCDRSDHSPQSERSTAASPIVDQKDGSSIGPTTPAPFQAGQRVQWPGQGLGSVLGIETREEKELLLVQMDTHRRLGVEVDKARDVLWSLPSRERALSLKKKLFSTAHPDPRELAERYPSIMKILADGSFQDRLDLTRREWARSKERSRGERPIDETLHGDVVAPIAEVLGEDATTLRRTAMETLRRGALEPRIPSGILDCSTQKAGKTPAVKVPHAKYLGTFQAGSGLVVGDPIYVESISDGQRSPQGIARNALFHGKPSSWHVYVRDGDSLASLTAAASSDSSKALNAVSDALPDEELIVEVLLLRRDTSAALVKQSGKLVDCVEVDSGRLTVMDLGRRDDSTLADINNFCGSGPVVREHGLVTPSGAGDGTYPVSVVEDARGAAMIRVRFEPPKFDQKAHRPSTCDSFAQQGP